MATIINSLSTSAALNILTSNNNFQIGTNSSSTAITIGNIVGYTGITFNVGSSGITIPSFNSYGSIVNTSAGLLSVAAAGTAGNILMSNGTSSLPSYQSLTSTSIPVDGTTISNTTNVHATGTFTGGLSTAPTNSNTATSAFGTSLTAGTSVQNTTGYNILCNICIEVSSATTATIVLGVGSATGPTTNTIIPSFTVASTTQYIISAIVPNQYWLLVNTTGTITIASINAQSCPL